MTIGRPQGPVWIGKPMDVVIPLSLDTADADGAMCLDAEVLQGDTPIPDRRVTVSLDRGAGGASMHIRSTVTVDEPVVTLNVRAGCSLATTRSFTLLADVPVDAALPDIVSGGAVASSAPLAPPRPAARQASRSAGGSGGVPGVADAGGAAARRNPAPDAQAGDAEAPVQRRARPPADAAPVVRHRPVAVRPPAVVHAPPPAPAQPSAPPEPPGDAAAARPRLQLEALDPAAAVAGSLKATPELTLPGAPDPARRAAAAALWNALDPAAAQRQQEADRSKELEAALVALRQQAAQNQKALLEMRSELAQARDSRYQNPLVYALIVLLLMALAGLFLLWRLAQKATAPAWWGEAAPAGKAAAPRRTSRGLLDDDMEPDDDDAPARRGDPPRFFPPTPFARLDSGELGSGPDEPAVLPLHHADGTPVRPVNTEELFDVQQQSDFFLSLGQQDQAIAVLREHIAANPGTSALAYLDLLRIYHSLERKDDYARLAVEFERVFNADVPDFAHFADAGRGLEYYRGALARIEALWPAPGTLALIEELVFRKPGGQEEGGFDLTAYQELLLLYSVAKEVIEPESPRAAMALPREAFADTISHEGPPTATAPIDVLAAAPPASTSAPAPAAEVPVLPPSLYG
ncbi:MAG TPA: hypothetical protein VGI11_04195, partial [Variovorax sp.]